MAVLAAGIADTAGVSDDCRTVDLGLPSAAGPRDAAPGGRR